MRSMGAGPGGTGPGAAERVLHIMRRNMKLIVLCLVLVPIAAYVVSKLQEKQYATTASLLFRDPGLDEKLFGAGLTPTESDPERNAQTNQQLVSLKSVCDRTSKALAQPGFDADRVCSAVEVAPAGQSDIINITATDPSPAFAARLANTFAGEYIAFRREADRAKVREAEELVQARLDSLSEEEQVGDEGQDLQEQARRLEILTSLQTGNAELVQRAVPPTSAASPKPARNVALGIILGIVLAAALTLLREQLDRRVRDAEDVREVIDLPVLANIPESRAAPQLATGEGSLDAAASEAFLLMRANLQYFNVDEKITTILITSAAPQEGKTTVSWNLARAEARANKKVLFLEADLRRPSLSRHLGTITTRGGLTLVLAEVLDAPEAIMNVHGVDVIPAGPLPPNPAELIESQRMRDLIRWGEQNYDRVIVDTPPTSVVADAIPLVTAVDGVVVVIRMGRSRRDAVQRLRNQLANMNAHVLGVVLNDSNVRKSEYYYGQRPGMFGDAGDQLAVGVANDERRERGRSGRAAAGRADSA
jgi:tyrosine-protein kinase